MPSLYCKCCGGTLAPVAGNSLLHRCSMCGKEQRTAAAEPFSKLMEAFDAQNREKVQKLLRRRHDVVTAEYISSAELIHICDELLTLMPEDFLSGFYKTAAGSNLRALNRAIREIDVERYYDDVAEIVPFLVASMTEDRDCLLSLNDLVERAYKKRDLTRFHEFSTLISKQAERVKSGVYETGLPRDVFVAYSSKDMSHVQDLVEELEGNQGFSCFVAARNLRHGVGSVEQYNAALAEAMNNCRTVVFVSSTNSRSFSCDALKIEMSYVMQQDTANAPPQHRNNYEAIPREYKKPRVEYRVEQSSNSNAADRKVAQFFAGYEWALTPADVANRVADQIFKGENPMQSAAASSAMPEKTAGNPPRQKGQDGQTEARKAAKADKPTEKTAPKAASDATPKADKKPGLAETLWHHFTNKKEQKKAEEEVRLASKGSERKAKGSVEPQKPLTPLKPLKWEVGDTVTFGSYAQNFKDWKDPIEWQVLAKEGGKALLVSKYLLEQHRYHPSKKDVTWETCEMRKWLNGKFLKAAFDAEEQRRILPSTIQNPNNPTWGTNGGFATIDRLFLLSFVEVEKYFSRASQRQVKATTYAQYRGVFVGGDKSNSGWWLRSPGGNSRVACLVEADGTLDKDGYNIDSEGGGVRPAMWINLES